MVANSKLGHRINRETLKSIKKARESIRRGNFSSEDDARKRLKI